jgi:hypothetical protein
MGSTNRLKPEPPSEAGVPEEIPDRSGIEGARLLANDAYPRLRASGFTRRQVRLWAETYVAETASGDLDAFLGWIARQEHAPEAPTVDEDAAETRHG